MDMQNIKKISEVDFSESATEKHEPATKEAKKNIFEIHDEDMIQYYKKTKQPRNF